MFDKSWKEMSEIDVSNYVDKKGTVDYLGWAVCKKMLHEYGAEKVLFTPLLNADNFPLFMSTETFEDKDGIKGRCYEVRIHITIDTLEFDYSYPIINGMYAIKEKDINQATIYKAIARAFVKGVAVYTGLGFGLWIKDEESKFDDLSFHDIFKIKRRIEELITAKLMSNPDLFAKIGLNDKQIASILALPEKINELEKRVKQA